jgi:hypothetical protein
MATSTTSRSGEQGAPAKTSEHQPRPTAPRATLPSVNPYNGQTLKNYLEMSAEDVDNAIAEAHERFPAWRRVPFEPQGSDGPPRHHSNAYETGGEAARRAADVIGTAKKITDALQTSVRLRKLVFHENNERWEDLISAQAHIMGNLRGERAL